MTPAAPRRQRQDGRRTRESILASAAALATVEGIDRISIGGLADHIGISKSGLFAHFRSKEALQLATIDYARDVFESDVLRPALTAPPGRATLVALIDAFTSHLERGVFPGGCFFAATLAEMHMRPGPVTARLEAFQRTWMDLQRTHAAIARDAGEIAADEDVEQLAFELESHVVHAHLTFPPTQDRMALERARRAVRHRLGVPLGA